MSDLEKNTVHLACDEETAARIMAAFAGKVEASSTDSAVVDIVGILNGEDSYEHSINRTLGALATRISPDRLYVLEVGEKTTSNTFEWCAPGIVAEIDMLQGLDNEEYLTPWLEMLKYDSCVIIPDVAKLRATDPNLHEILSQQGIERLIAVPFYDEDQLIGFLGADNYQDSELIDTRRVLEAAAYHLGHEVRIHNKSVALEAERVLLEQRANELEVDSGTDALTGALNRRGGDRAIEKLLGSEHPPKSGALIMADIDGFKEINDLYGHAAGDAILVDLVNRQRAHHGNDAIVIRNGGDEFIVFDYRMPLDQMDAVLKRVARQKHTVEFEGLKISYSVSIGYATYPDQGDDLGLLCSHADMALYHVKLAGKGEAERYCEDIDNSDRDRLGFSLTSIADSLPGALFVFPLDHVGKIIFANRGMFELFKCRDWEDFSRRVGDTYRDVPAHWDLWKIDELTMGQGEGEEGNVAYLDYDIVAADGTIIPVSTEGRLVNNDRLGAMLYVYLTPKKSGKDAGLQSGDNEWREIAAEVMTRLDEGVCFIDSNMTIVFWNDAAERITGYRSDEVIGMSCWEGPLRHIDVDGVPKCSATCPLSKKCEAGSERHAEFETRRKDGIPLQLKMDTYLLTESGGSVKGVEVFKEARRAN